MYRFMELLQSGQWIGSGTGDNNFDPIIIDLDDNGDYLSGQFCAFEKDPNLPSIEGRIHKLDKTKKRQTIDVFHKPIHQLSPNILRDEDFKKYWPDVKMSKTSTLAFNFEGDNLELEWFSKSNRGGTCKLIRSNKNKNSECSTEGVGSWSEFKSLIDGKNIQGHIFRGQPGPWRLCTSFHRTNRKDLVYYDAVDIPEIHRTLSSELDDLLDLSNPIHRAALYYLIQHHGYPTPLLDWTYSPYIAAYFAFRNTAHIEGNVRVYSFNNDEWVNDFRQLSLLSFTKPHLSILIPIAVGNKRSIPQQGLSTISNLNDIETYVKKREAENNKTYLTAIDIPKSERDNALRDLSLMGITAGSMFPGLDGACEYLKMKNFN